MTSISPTRVSMYDFLYQDTKPMVSLLADAAQLSVPQSRIALTASLQAIISALLAYQQTYQSQALYKKLLTRGAIKELREYNAMNFATIQATLYTRNDVTDAVFGDKARVHEACSYIAAMIDDSPKKVKILLTCLCVIVLRELAILVDYSQLDAGEIDQWFALQPQFLRPSRFEHAISAPATWTFTFTQSNPINAFAPIRASQLNALSGFVLSAAPPPMDPYWYTLTGFEPSIANDASSNQEDESHTTPHYLKVIRRAQSHLSENRAFRLFTFLPMPTIHVPHQRWLLQLAQISDTYLRRNRLRITSEPQKAPTPPVINLGRLTNNTDAASKTSQAPQTSTSPKTSSEVPITSDTAKPLWRNPVILIIIVVIGGLSALATLKYQNQQANGAVSAISAVSEHDQKQKRAAQDVAMAQADSNANVANGSKSDDAL